MSELYLQVFAAADGSAVVANLVAMSPEKINELAHVDGPWFVPYDSKLHAGWQPRDRVDMKTGAIDSSARVAEREAALPDSKLERCVAIDARTTELSRAGFPWGDRRITVDDNAATKIIATLIAAQGGMLSYPLDW